MTTPPVPTTAPEPPRRPELEAWENEGGALAADSQVPRRPSAEELRLRNLFQQIDLPEICGIDFSNLSHQEIANLLPAYGGEHPMRAILIDQNTRQAYGIASGWDPDTMTHNGMPFRSGALTPGAAAQAGIGWQQQGNHVEPVAAAFMRRRGISRAVVYINGTNPCWGRPDGTGCHAWLPAFLAEGFQMTVYNKYGANLVASRPDRLFNYTGHPD